MWTDQGLKYGPPTFNVDAVHQGLLKYDHVWPTCEVNLYYTTVEWVSRILSPVLVLAVHRTPAEAIDNLKLDKSIGQPHQMFVGPHKQQWVDVFDFESSVIYFLLYTCLLNTTKKDEMRLLGKLARIMRPVDVVLALVGDFLFGGLLDKINSSVFKTPSFVGAQIPGSDMADLWGSLYQFMQRAGAFAHDTDMQGHDNTCALFVWMIVRDVVRPFVPEDRRSMVNRYFDMVFFGWTVVEGSIYQIPGQSTGQTLTAFGNTTALISMMCLHAIKKGLCFDQFREQVLFYAFGDDMIYASVNPKFSVVALSETFLEYGMFLETDSLAGKNFVDLTFLSSSPVWVEGGGYKFLAYQFNTDKLVASFHYKRSDDVNINLSRYVSLALALWGDRRVFEFWRRRVLDWYRSKKNQGIPFDPEPEKALVSLLTSDSEIRKIYFSRQESRRFFHFSPFGDLLGGIGLH